MLTREGADIIEEYGICQLGEDLTVFEPVTIGFPSRERLHETGFPGTVIGRNAVLRSGTIIYCDVTIGDHFSTGHNVIVRERTTIGDHVSVGTASIIEGNCTIGDRVSIQSMVFVPTHTAIGNGVFIGPNAVLTNDRYPPSGLPRLEGPVIGDDAVIGANATILPGVNISRGAAVAAGAIVTRDVPPGVLAIGAPAVLRPLPDAMRRRS